MTYMTWQFEPLSYKSRMVEFVINISLYYSNYAVQSDLFIVH